MSSNKVFDVEVMSVDTSGNIACNGSITAAGGVVGDVTGQVFGNRSSYSASGAISIHDTAVVLSASDGALSMTLAGGPDGSGGVGTAQVLYIKAINFTVNDIVITPSNFFDGTSITFSSGAKGSAILIFNGSSWEVYYTDGTIA